MKKYQFELLFIKQNGLVCFVSFLNLIFEFEHEKLSQLSRNGPQVWFNEGLKAAFIFFCNSSY